MLLTRAQIRELDRRAMAEYGLAGVVLMENAGRGAMHVLCSLGIPGLVVICCGRGNNAGDGFVMARHLDAHGFTVRVLLFTDPAELRGDAAVNFQILARSGVSVEWLRLSLEEAISDSAEFEEENDRLDAALSEASWLVDALLGTGAQGEPRPPFDRVIERMNAAGPPIVALDLPSGLDCDTGVAADTTIRADHTITFAAAKPGLLNKAATQFVGRLHLVDIGVPRKLLEEFLVPQQAKNNSEKS